MSSHLSFHSTGRVEQGVAGCLKRPRDVLSSILLVGCIMIACEIWSRVLLGTKITKSGLDVRTEGKRCHVSNKRVPHEARGICHVSA